MIVLPNREVLNSDEIKRAQEVLEPFTTDLGESVYFDALAVLELASHAAEVVIPGSEQAKLKALHEYVARIKDEDELDGLYSKYALEAATALQNLSAILCEMDAWKRQAQEDVKS